CKPRTEISACLRHRGAGADRSSGPEDSHLDPRQERATLTSQCPRVEGDVMAGRSTGHKRQLSLVSLVALAAGAVLGGWLAEAPYWFELTGAGAALIFPILAVILIPIGLAFAELTSAMPFSSSVDVWSSSAMNPTMGWATQWLFFLVQVVE